MKALKLLLGIGAACAACCAIPFFGGSAVLAAGAGGLLACADEFALPAFALAGIALLSGVFWWRSRRLQRQSACGCSHVAGAKEADHVA